MRFLKCSFFVFVVSLGSHAGAAPVDSGTLCQFLLAGPVDAASMLPSYGPTLQELFPYDLLFRDYSSYPFVVGERLDAVSLRILSPTPAEKARMAELIEKATRSLGPVTGAASYEEVSRAISERAQSLGATKNPPALSAFEMVKEYEEKFHRESPANARFVYRWSDVRFAMEGLRMKNVTVRESPITLLPREMQIEILDRVLAMLERESKMDRRAELMLRRVRYLRARAENTPFTLANGPAAALGPHEPSPGEPQMLIATLMGVSTGGDDVAESMRYEIQSGLQPENPAARAMFEEFLEEVVLPLGKLTPEEYFHALNSVIEIRADFGDWSVPQRSSSGQN